MGDEASNHAGEGALVLFVIGGVLMLVVWPGAVLWNASLGTSGVIRCARDAERRRDLHRGVVRLCAAASLVASMWVAAAYAEGATGWVDPDGDGMYADMQNGSYDWVDINGGDWAMATTVLGALILCVTWGVLRAISDDDSQEPIGEHQHGLRAGWDLGKVESASPERA